ncbi:MAG TPA: hypothetical protein VN958_19605 [Chitinophagaceae bacterium]|nr:hypothetical protein [Chitinophagaceae bacterium]
MLVQQIIDEINCPVYSSPKQPIEPDIKIFIVQMIHELIGSKRPLQPHDNGIISIKPEHISIFITISNKLIEET